MGPGSGSTVARTGRGTLVVIAKEPVPGQVKTRLCPPCTPAGAAAIAEAALADTLATVRATPADRYVIALDGAAGAWLPDGFEVIAQRGGGLDERLTAAFTECFAATPGEPIVLVGMDTPQLTVAHLTDALARLAATPTADADRAEVAPEIGSGAPRAVLGPAPDGGYWLIGMCELRPGAIEGVPMSEDDTFLHQHAHLRACGYRVELTDELPDVDHAADAVAIAATIPDSRFAAAVRGALPDLVGATAASVPTASVPAASPPT